MFVVGVWRCFLPLAVRKPSLISITAWLTAPTVNFS